eukprot:TRINITY_DN2412_c0_g1_i4.p1 TRINITY_DN2412_c0_g1~~TRINITY_DN2412_c0_g1_i4.p1  ORF type:complete len:480 (+),score=120.35 TRINITY_DN2412_c0_g1_i4:30-1442(+)
MVELQFNRIDLLQVGQLHRRTVRVIPAGEEGTAAQAVALGDESGAALAFVVRKGDLAQRFRTMPPSPASPITTMQTGGPLNSLKDRIFYAVTHSVVGVSKKGREFFRFDTNMTEVIRNMYLEGPDMFLAGDYSMFHYVETRDQDFYMCNDRINDLVCAHITSDSEFDAILACHDKALRVIQGSECLFEIPVPSAATALSLLSQKGTDKTFVYGTNKGELGSVLVNNSEFKNKWTVSSETSSSGINVITVCDFSRSGCRDVAVGRDDGTVEVLSFTEGDMDKPPVTTFKTRLNESIQSIEHGRVINPNYEEIVVGSFSGKIIGFSPEPATLAVPEITDRAHEKQRIAEIEADLKKRVEDTEVEVKRLQGCLQREMDKVKERPALVIPQIDVNVQFSLDAKGSHYLLSIETKCPLEYITFACDVLLEMEEVDHTQCAIMLSPPVPEVCLLSRQHIISLQLSRPARCSLRLAA